MSRCVAVVSFVLAALSGCDTPPPLYAGRTWCASGTTVKVISRDGFLWHVRVSGEEGLQPYSQMYAPDCDNDPACSWGACEVSDD